MPPTDLVAELAKKSGLLWISYAGRAHAVWHEWIGDAVCLVAGGTEQQLPEIAEQETVTLLLRSKSTRALAAQIESRVEVVPPGSEHWEATTTALKTGRLNLLDAEHAIERWAAESIVVRLVPVGDPVVPSMIDSSLPATRPLLSPGVALGSRRDADGRRIEVSTERQS